MDLFQNKFHSYFRFLKKKKEKWWILNISMTLAFTEYGVEQKASRLLIIVQV